VLTHQNETKKSETLTNHGIPYLTYRSQIGTINTRLNSNHRYHQPYSQVCTLNLNKQTKNLADDAKHNPQTELPVLNWHNENPNITTAEMLTVLPH
jgi:hypothetical protein